MIYLCCDRRRRNAVAEDGTLNGIDYLEVLDTDAPAGSPRQQTLLVHCLRPLVGLDADNVLVEGGERFNAVQVRWAVVADAVPPAMVAAGEISAAEQAYFAALPDPEQLLVVRTDSSGDYAPYRLRLVTAPNDHTPLAGFDAQLSSIEFSFKVECPNDFDCEPPPCPSSPVAEPQIDYLAKDYASFRRLMLDRLSLLIPEWTERSPADLGMTLVELLATVGDHLSYQQDAAATEAYLGTARSRISVRRHARLVDYRIDDGSNARTWVQVECAADLAAAGPNDPVVPKGTKIVTALDGVTSATVEDDPLIWRDALRVFETKEPLQELFAAHNRMPFHTWSDQECCLPPGSTEATLRGEFPDLEPGMVLVFEEVLGPNTGRPGDADPTHRHPVRLTEVAIGQDPVGPAPVPITQICWHREDALPFPLCLSSVTAADQGENFVDEVSVARGNIVLADHGLTLPAENLGSVPSPTTFAYESAPTDACSHHQPEPLYPRFQPRLSEGPLTQAARFFNREARQSPAAAVFSWHSSDVLPEIVVTGDLTNTPETWRPRLDLLGSDSDHRHFVAELESDGSATLRFGDDDAGRRPQPEQIFEATYRVGNGVAGNIGTDALRHLVLDLQQITRVRNLTPGMGGRDPESIADVRKNAPQAFRVQERAVTEADYAEVTERDPEVQKAAASFRWTGSWHTAFVTVDRLEGLNVDPQFIEHTKDRLERYRMAGVDTEVDEPRHVSLEIDLRVCLESQALRSEVNAQLQETLSRDRQPDGSLGLFHPDNFSFGQPVYSSPIYAAAQSIPGVAAVQIKTFQRQDEPWTDATDTGRLEMERLEIARLDNDPNYPRHGVLRIELEGGK